ncbi:hypothetical protein BBJ28_00019938 [Nothophytophthora sp. Chile5]|nr:hypothetical protein BBJ28_00019938 [Nothophytophthora sp. Chile5]
MGCVAFPRMKEVEDAMHSLKVKLLVVDCVATLFLKVSQYICGLYTKPLLGEGWAHCVTTRVSACCYDHDVVGGSASASTLMTAGVVAVEDLEATRELEIHDFAIHDALLSDLALAELPSVDPACTLRSTQQSAAEDPDETQLDGEETQLDEASDQEEEEEEGARATSESSSFDLVSDSNEEEDEPFYLKVTEE